jgi:threonine/homoserine/homoserine lactone efflux protein
VIRRVLFLIGGCAAFWLLVGLPARHLGGGDRALVFLGTALLLCLAPAVATLVWGERALRRSADNQLVMVLGGTGVRMLLVLLAGWTFNQYIPFYQQQPSFLIWLAVGYLFTLGLEMVLLLAGRPDEQPERIQPRSTIQ